MQPREWEFGRHPIAGGTRRRAFSDRRANVAEDDRAIEVPFTAGVSLEHEAPVVLGVEHPVGNENEFAVGGSMERCAKLLTGDDACARFENRFSGFPSPSVHCRCTHEERDGLSRQVTDEIVAHIESDCGSDGSCWPT